MKASTLPTLMMALGRAESSALADADLLDLYTGGGDQAAFTQLVQRYARLVWRVARTRCRSEVTAEDVFQATFVVLAKKAGSIRVAGALAGWLHRTAHRLAVKATRAEAKAKPDRPRPVQTNPLDDLSARELLATVDDELAKLTDAERTVLILCGVDGEPLDDVATRLGCSTTVVKGRLQRARAKLRSRLELRGLTLPAVLVGLFAAPTLATIQAAVKAATSTTYSLAVSTLIAEGINMKATMMKATMTLALCGMIAIVGGGSGSPNSAPRVIAAPLPKAKPPEGVIVLSSFSKKTKQIELTKPDGESLKVFEPKGNVVNARLSPDGKRIAYFDLKPTPGVLNGSLAVFDFCWFDAEADGLEVQKIAENVSGGVSHTWSADGQTVYYSQLDPEKYDDSAKPGALMQYRSYAFIFKTKKSTELKLPAEQMILDIAPDGKSLLTSSQCNGAPTRSLFLTPLDTCKPQLLVKDETVSSNRRFSPDGKQLLLSRVGFVAMADKDKGPGVYLLDLTTKKERKIQLPDEIKDSQPPFNACWSPDGKRIAIHWNADIPQPPGAFIPVGPLPAGKSGWLASRVTVCDIDGGNAKTIIRKEYKESVTGIDWAPVRLPEEKDEVDRKISAPLPKPKFEWKEAKGIQFDPHSHGDRITGLAHSPDGKFIAVAVGNQVRLLDAVNLKQVNEHALTAKAPGTITSVAFSPKGDKLAMTAKDFVFLYSELGKSPSVSSDSSWEMKGIDAHQVAFSTDQDDNVWMAATNGEETAIRMETGKTSSDWSIGGTVKARNVQKPFVFVPGTSILLRVAFENEANDPKPVLQLCDVVDGKKSKWLKGHKARPTAAVVSADGKRIVSVDEGGTIIVWEVEKAEFKEKSRIELGNGVLQLTLAPDGRTVAVVRTVAVEGTEVKGGWRFVEPELHVFDVTNPPAKPKPLWTTKIGQDWQKIAGPVSLAFSPDGKRLLAAFGDPYNSGMDDKGIWHTGIIPGSMGIKVWNRE